MGFVCCASIAQGVLGAPWVSGWGSHVNLEAMIGHDCGKRVCFSFFPFWQSRPAVLILLQLSCRPRKCCFVSVSLLFPPCSLEFSFRSDACFFSVGGMLSALPPPPAYFRSPRGPVVKPVTGHLPQTLGVLTEAGRIFLNQCDSIRSFAV